MEHFTGWQYLLIDAASQFGLDKLTYGPRIEWAEQNLHQLEELADDADDVPMYRKSVMAIRDAQAGKPSGHPIGFDAVCSGMQVMSTVTGCATGAESTGLVNPDERADAYTKCTSVMSNLLSMAMTNDRSDVKQAVMTVLYGSKREPKNIFGEDTPELDAFYQAVYAIAPGAYELLDDLLKSWNPYSLAHVWTMPDGYVSRVKVMQKVENVKIEVDELDHHTFEYEYYINEGCKSAVSNAANVVHSIDAYVLRQLERRCNYDRETIEWASYAIQMVLMERSIGITHNTYNCGLNEGFKHLVERYNATGMADIRILDYTQSNEVFALSTTHLKALAKVINSMLEYQPFEIITVHDDFKCLPNNMNHLRQQYINIFSELAQSTVIDDILSQLYGTPIKYPKKSTDLHKKIEGSNYAIC